MTLRCVTAALLGLLMFACDSDAEPACRGSSCGLDASDGHAETTPRADAADDEGRAPDGADEIVEGAPSECGQMTMVADDFESLLPFETWTTAGGVSVQAQNVDGRAELALGPVPGFGGYLANARASLWSSSLYVEVVALPDLASTARVALRMSANDTDRLELEEQGGVLYARFVLAKVPYELAQTDYDPQRHRWWRLSEADGQIAWQTSADAITWESLASAPVPFELSWLRAELVAQTAEAGTSPGLAAFDNVNGGASAGAWCPLNEWTEHFDDGALDARWVTWRQAGCSIVLGDGGVGMRPVPGIETACGMRSAQRVDMRDSELTVEVTELVGPAGVVAKVGIEIARDVFAGFSDVGPHLRLTLAQGVDVRTLASFDDGLESHRWWRLREHAGILYWETSRTGEVWVTHAAEAIAEPLDAVSVEFELVQYESNPDPRQFRFDNFNLPPIR